MAFLALTLGSCMDGYAVGPRPDREGACISMGQQQPEGRRMMIIADFEDPACYDYQRQWLQSLIEKDMMIKAVVTGNDVSGNIYNQVSAYRMHPALSSFAINGSGLSVGFLLVRDPRKPEGSLYRKLQRSCLRLAVCRYQALRWKSGYGQDRARHLERALQDSEPWRGLMQAR